MGNFLDKNQKQQLEAELRHERRRKHADWTRIILLLDKGETYADIAKFLFLDDGTIPNYRRRYKVIYNTYYPKFEEFKLAVSSFFKGLRGHREELATMLTDNFHPVGT